MAGVALAAAALGVRCGQRAPAVQRQAQPAASGQDSVPLPAPAEPRPQAREIANAAPARDAAIADPALDTERSSEQALMDEAVRVLERTPQQTLTLIEAADRRFGSEVEARRKLEIEALVRLQRIGLAHAKADHFYRAFPDSSSIREIERRTGYHPRPTGPTQ